MQPAFSPLGIVSARITTVEEEKRRGRRIARESGCLIRAAFKSTFSCSRIKTGQWALLLMGLF